MSLLQRNASPLRRDIDERASKTALYTFTSTLLPYLFESWLGTITQLDMIDRGMIFAAAATVFATVMSVAGSLISTRLGAKGTASLTTAYDYHDAKPVDSPPRSQE